MTHTWPEVLSAIAAHTTLSPTQVSWAMNDIMAGQSTPAQTAAFIYGIAVKGIEPVELEAAAATMLEFAQPVELPEGTRAVDIVGTGGDGAHTVNVSTMSSLLVASMGETVVKHGNRAASSKSGGADMLEALGISIEQDPETAVANARSHHFAFLFAKLYHPAMRFAGPIRSELKVPTLFNLLGPMTNPSRPTSGLIGCAFERMQPIMAEAFARRGDQVLVVRGDDGLDEVSISGPTQVFSTLSGGVEHQVIEPATVGLPTFGFDALRGGSPAYNAAVARALFGLEQPAPVVGASTDGNAGHDVGEAGVVGTETAKAGESLDVPVQTLEAARAAVLFSSAAALVTVRGLQGLSLDDALRREFTNVEAALDAGAPRRLVESLIAQ